MKNSIHSGLSKTTGERGAALITALLLSVLVMTAGGLLVLITATGAGVTADAASETQAYYAAEAGLEETLRVLRGNVSPNIDFRKAVTPSESNAAGDTSGVARLSKWITYSTTYTDRVPLTNSYSPLTGTAYSVVITDPDSIVAPAQPNRLLVRATGYGPRGAIKRLELMVRKGAFDFSPVSTLLMRGDDSGSRMDSFSIGESNAKTYSGDDAATPSQGSLPVFGTTNNADTLYATTTVATSKPITVTSSGAPVKKIDSGELPIWLRTADGSRAMLNEMQAIAQSSGRYFNSSPVDFGSTSQPKLTFVNGDCNLTGGAGLLIVTGELNLSGNVSFNGLILVMGDGAMLRNGGGSGDIYGAIVVSRFQRTWPASENNQPHPFLAPRFDSNGGGASTVQYNSTWVRRALNTTGITPMAVREY